MTTNKHFFSIKFAITICFMVFFIFVIASANRFSEGKQELVVSSNFVGLNDSDSPEINLDEITSVQLDENERGVIKYTVQAGDSLERIARTFGTTVSHIQTVNKISGSIRPKDILMITDEQGIVYVLPEKTNIVVFANRYNLKLEDLMTLNYIQDESEILFPDQEIFLNISLEDAYNKGLLERPAPVIVSKPRNRPVITKPQGTARNTAGTTTRATSKKGNIISQWTYTKNIKNQFSRGYCTWYAAIISPEIFPYVDENTQKRDFGGNAAQRCANAKKAGFPVGKKPGVGALIVYGGGAGHVEKVINYYPEEGKMILRGMNYVGKFIVTDRYEYTSNSSISCYIYAK